MPLNSGTKRSLKRFGKLVLSWWNLLWRQRLNFVAWLRKIEWMTYSYGNSRERILMRAITIKERLSMWWVRRKNVDSKKDALKVFDPQNLIDFECNLGFHRLCIYLWLKIENLCPLSRPVRCKAKWYNLRSGHPRFPAFSRVFPRFFQAVFLFLLWVIIDSKRYVYLLFFFWLTVLITSVPFLSGLKKMRAVLTPYQWLGLISCRVWPFDPFEWLTSNFSLQHHPWITH